jgi:hypothetical protein
VLTLSRLFYGIKRIVRLALVSAPPQLSASYHTGISAHDGKSQFFEILEFDIVLSDMNCMASLPGCSDCDNDLKTPAILGRWGSFPSVRLSDLIVRRGYCCRKRRNWPEQWAVRSGKGIRDRGLDRMGAAHPRQNPK